MADENSPPLPATTALAAMHDLVLDTLQPTVHDVAAGKVLVTSDDHRVHDLEKILDEHREHPRRARESSVHHTLASLIQHARRHARPESADFCELAGVAPKVTVVYDYQPAQDASRGAWREHRATYAFPPSDAWVRWTGVDGKALSVAAFAQLLEDGIADVRDPASADANLQLPGVRYASPAELLTLAEGLSVRVEQVVVDQRRAANGTCTMTFAEAHADEKGEPLKIPGGFLLGIPVFLGGAAYAVPARLRYRVKNRQVEWSVHLHNAETCRRDAITEAAATFSEESGVVTYMGAAG